MGQKHRAFNVTMKADQTKDNLRQYMPWLLFSLVIIPTLFLMIYIDQAYGPEPIRSPTFILDPIEGQSLDLEPFLNRSKRAAHHYQRPGPRFPGHLFKKLKTGALGKIKKILVKGALKGKLRNKTRFRRAAPHPALSGPTQRIPGSFLPFSKTFNRSLLETLRRDGPETPAFLTKNKNIQGNPLAPRA